VSHKNVKPEKKLFANFKQKSEVKLFQLV